MIPRPVRAAISLFAMILSASPIGAAEDSYDGFLGALADRESNGDYAAANALGYLGAYQFGEPALIDLGLYVPDGTPENDWIGKWTGRCGIHGKTSFLDRPDIQDAVMKAWADKLWRYSTDPAFALDRYVGQTVAGIRISPAAIVAGAHLVGIWGIAAFLRSGGLANPTDPFGVPVSEYVEMFARYETPWPGRGAAPQNAPQPPTEGSRCAG